MSSSFAQPSMPPISSNLNSPATPGPPVSANKPITKAYKAYFSQEEIEILFTKQRGQASTTNAERTKQLACGLIDAIGLRIGFPRRVIATGQALYHRFHLYFPMSEFNHIEVSLSTLYVAAKLHDCLKKPRDLILASYAIRQPDMLKGRLALSVDPAMFDPKQLESERKRMLSVERLVLETLCFNLMVGAEGGGSPGLDAFGLIIKLGRKAGYRRKFIFTSWKMVIDSYRTIASLSYTPQAICIACFYATALLQSPPQDIIAATANEGVAMAETETEMAEDIAACFRVIGEWQQDGDRTWLHDLSASIDDVYEIVHLILDLHGFLLQSATRSTTSASDISLTPSFGTPVSPSDPSSSGGPQPTRTALNMHPQLIPALPLPVRCNWTQERLMQLKIWLRERYPKPSVFSEELEPEPFNETKQLNIDTLTKGFGRNDETIRFLFW
ncbi:hypothetical protein NliqN6_4076 [Naganishia liquefaciens]|uniref:Cyclin N-terminal domain-containing protein n=1 Tax=Naganishia liquefaciens TaxID=104408 RepID=A0A8H3TV65_9TREE|nr:hypothetical protein NliqN6_4076 [Naganishia liquefaciens]